MIYFNKDEDNVEKTKLNTTFNKHQTTTSLLDTSAETNSNPQENENIFKINRNNTKKINELNLNELKCLIQFISKSIFIESFKLI